MSDSVHDRALERKRKLVNRKRGIAYRLRAPNWGEQSRPMFAARNIHDDLAEKARGLGEGGIGAVHLLARQVGLIDRIDEELHLPPGTSKWNQIERRMFSFISQNWRGRPLLTRATIMDLIGHTKTKTGLTVRRVLDRRPYPKRSKSATSRCKRFA